MHQVHGFPKLFYLIDLLQSGVHTVVSHYCITSLNSIVKCNCIFDQLGSMFSIVLLFFSLSLSVYALILRSRPVIFDHIFDKCV